jgi:two-component system, chemotaxis family, protein-glutamate methylesterase/glutaminase
VTDSHKGPEQPIRVVVIEDSKLLAEQLVEALEQNPRLAVAGVAHNGSEGRDLVARTHPDVVTLDVNMPGMDGLTCLQYIMVERPTPCVIVSAITGDSAFETFEAYELGAVDVIQKPQGIGPGREALFNRRLAAKIIRASYADPTKITRYQPTDESGSSRPSRSRAFTDPSAPQEIVVIGASTGGPRTVMEIVARLPADLQSTVLIIQHMPGSFTGSFARRLNEICPLPTREAEHGERLARGTVLVAPGDFHLRLTRAAAGAGAVVALDADTSEQFVVPSVDVALHSAVELFGERTLGVVLTGIGSDGAEAMVAVQAAGGVTIAESQASAVIYGMPKAVVSRGAADQILPARKIAPAIVSGLESMGAEP